MIPITRSLALNDDEIDEHFTRAQGPGGQHVNKTETAVMLRFDVVRSPSLPDAVKARLLQLAGRRMTLDGVLVMTAQQHRSHNKTELLAAELPRVAGSRFKIGQGAGDDADQRDADLDRGQEFSGIGSQRERAARAADAAFDQRREARRTGGDDRKLRHRQQTVDDDQDRHDRKFQIKHGSP